MNSDKPNNWSVYIIKADDGSYYTGISTDVARRFSEHCGSTGGARYFNGRKPLAIVYHERGHDRSSATKREFEIKKLNRQQKALLIGSAVGAEFDNTEHG